MLRRQEYTVELKKKNMSNLFRKKIIYKDFGENFLRMFILKKLL